MSASAMTTEEFLTARGWAPRPGGWDPPSRPAAGPTYDIYPTAIPTAKALEIQLREERRINEFLLTQDVSAQERAALEGHWRLHDETIGGRAKGCPEHKRMYEEDGCPDCRAQRIRKLLIP